ncbi:MAG: T9SS type A sorting domain-containing protein [Bacteroidia bacterium]
MKLNLPLMGAALGLALGLNAQTGRNAVITKNTKPGQTVSSSEKQVFSNRGCGTQTPSEEWNTWFNQKVEEHKAEMASGKAQIVNYTIPVIVHVIHTGQAVGTFPNISQAQIQSQITVLNQDYASNGYNVNNLPAVFQPAKANTGLQFCLATKDPNGNLLTEPGIDRISATSMTAALGSYPSKDPANSAYSTTSSFMGFVDGYIKPNTIWNPLQYMNIWITNEQSAVGLLGYATFPVGTGLTGITGNGSATTDGLWCWAKAFGSNIVYPGGIYDPTYNKGRTAVHEIGHWVGLRHTWGDGTCATDYCTDTPPSQTANYGCPTHPYKLGVCTGNTTGEMFQNFMDYTDDPCMYIFTNDQTTRIQTAMQNGTYRNQLTASAATLCTIPAAAPVANMSLPTTGCTNSAVTVNNNSSGNPTPTYAWSSNPAGAVFNPNNTATNPTITFATPGSYTITVVATNSLGSNSNSKNITISTCTTAASCNDTLSNFGNTDTLTVYSAGSDTATPGCSPNAGYVAGNNCYGDKEKAEFYAYSQYSNIALPKINGVIVLFYKNGGFGTAGNSASSVGMKLYNGTSATAAPGTLITQTATTLGAILAAPSVSNVAYCGDPTVGYNSAIIKPYRFNFSTPVNAPTSGGFYASLVLPTGTGDTAVVFNNGNSATNTAWELWSNNAWHDMFSAWGSGPTYNLAILPIMTCGSVGIRSNSVLDNNIVLYPNPSNGMVSLIATLPSTQSLDVTVHNALGQLISNNKYSSVASNVFNLDLTNSSNGVYFVTIDNGQEKIVKRLIISK